MCAKQHLEVERAVAEGGEPTALPEQPTCGFDLGRAIGQRRGELGNDLPGVHFRNSRDDASGAKSQSRAAISMIGQGDAETITVRKPERRAQSSTGASSGFRRRAIWPRVRTSCA